MKNNEVKDAWCHRCDNSAFLPMTMSEVAARGWDQRKQPNGDPQPVDVVFVTGDAYVDHPSFATALLGRVLEAEGFRVAILAQPDWHSCDAWRTFGRPKLCFCVSAGNMDSMINHYTASRKVRNDDAYSPDGKIGKRPDRATLAYCQRTREAFPGVPIIAGGVEASLRRLAHYDFWSDKVKRSILMDAKADLLVYGMGETALVEVVKRLAAGEAIATIRDVRGTVWRIGASEDLPEEDETTLHLPSFEEVADRHAMFNEMTRLAYQNLNPYHALRLVQEHLQEAVVVNPPAFPLVTAEMDRIYGLPFVRRPHPSYGDAVIPAFEVVKTSVTILRGCFGGCAFCSLAAHQGKFVQSRSQESVLEEVKLLVEQPHRDAGRSEAASCCDAGRSKAASCCDAGRSKAASFSGIISDLGGPTANMYRMGGIQESTPGNTAGRETDQCKNCHRTSCLWPEICENLNTDHRPVIDLMRAVRETDGVRQVFIASGVRTDLAQLSPDYVEELIRHHVGGHLKTAPEHTDERVLEKMRKPDIANYDGFVELFESLCAKHGKDRYLVPYLIAGLPGSSIPSMIRVAEYLHKHGIRPEQVQDFLPGPFELATAMYFTGRDPMTDQQLHVARGMRERRIQHSLLQYYKPENYHDVKMALRDYGRQELIGYGSECLIPPYPPKEQALKHRSRVKRLERKTNLEKAQRAEFRKKKDEETAERKRKEREAKRNERRAAYEAEHGSHRDDRRTRKPFGNQPFRDRDKSQRDGNQPFRDRDKPQRDGNKPFRDRDKSQRDGNKPFRDRDKSQRDGNQPFR
ncbi:MAG: YgiQ family radical SAM protein, partial [Planctomycetaceae bacterium]|nr:YgiQ family radical SAM protein [Planctomycetaceae bacterium]